MRKNSQSNVNNQDGEPVPNYLVFDFAEKKDVAVSYKSPLSVAIGATYTNKSNTKTLYATIEYFSSLDAYRMVKAEVNEDVVSGRLAEALVYEDWLSYVWGAKAVTNLALGYRWIIKENLMILAGARTDFSYRKGVDYHPYLEHRTVKGFDIDKYHLTGGLTINVFGQDLMAGLQYSIGAQKDQQQFINLSDPIEYNPENFTALQGVKSNNMNVLVNSLSLYFGATINFGSRK
jgi:hypothetical protein